MSELGRDPAGERQRAEFWRRGHAILAQDPQQLADAGTDLKALGARLKTLAYACRDAWNPATPPAQLRELLEQIAALRTDTLRARKNMLAAVSFNPAIATASAGLYDRQLTALTQMRDSMHQQLRDNETGTNT